MKRRIGRQTLGTVLCCAAVACAASRGSAQFFGHLAQPAATAPPASIAARMGLEMPESAARHGIAFTPFTPPRRIVTTALLPPFHGDDVRANRGIAFEYSGGGDRRYALAEWPANGGTIEGFPRVDTPDPQCPGERTFSRGTTPSGIVWSTPRGLIMTLQADGANDARTLESEWRKLIRRGACR